MRQGFFQAGEAGDHAAEPGDGEDALNRGACYDQPQLATFGQGSLVRCYQGMEPGRVAELGPAHVDHQAAVPVPGRFEQGRPQAVSESSSG